MALIATINGKKVYSDKAMNGIVNGRITFADGSWCDASTGEVYNAASSGYIKIGGTDPGNDAEKTVRGPERVSASALELRQLAADVRVEVHNARHIEYVITGPSAQVEAIRARVQGGALVIEGDGSRASGSMVINNVSGVHISNGDIVIGNVVGRGSFMSNVFGGNSVTSIVTGGGGNEVEVIVKVPRGTAVTSGNVSGKVVIGDIDAPLSASASTSRSVRAGRVTAAQLQASSSGSIYVKEANGPVVANASSSGDIDVKSGDMPSLMASASSSGEISIGGVATMATLQASSSGRVDVARVRQTPMRSESSSGRVDVRRIG